MLSDFFIAAPEKYGFSTPASVGGRLITSAERKNSEKKKLERARQANGEAQPSTSPFFSFFHFRAEFSDGAQRVHVRMY